MFSYFGAKTRIVARYPPPRHRLIVEPFAGSARYSLLHHRGHEVWLNDLDPLVCDIWRYIRTASRRDIMTLPELRAGERLDRHRLLSGTERALLGWCMGYGLAGPANTCTEWGERKRLCRKVKERILTYRPYVRDWTITCDHYSALPNVEAAWHIDPPYQHGRSRYRYHCVADYDRLARWCRSRRGQVMVCEGRGATWLPFRPFATHQASRGVYQELIWTNERVGIRAGR